MLRDIGMEIQVPTQIHRNSLNHLVFSEACVLWPWGQWFQLHCGCPSHRSPLLGSLDLSMPLRSSLAFSACTNHSHLPRYAPLNPRLVTHRPLYSS